MRIQHARYLGLLTSCLLLASGCATSEQAGAGTTSTTPSAEAASATPAAWASVSPFEDGSPRLGPAEPAIGTPYPFDLYVHCEGEFARFGGRFWHSATPPGNLSPLPEADGSRKITGFVAGTMELIDVDTARFIIDTRYVDTAEPVVQYELALQTPPGCM